MQEFWYNFIKPTFGERTKLCYMDIDSFIAHIKTKDIYKDISEDDEKRCDTLNYEVHRPLPMGKNKKAVGLMKDELGGQIMKKFIGLRAKTYSYLKDNNDECKKAKVQKSML